jgi:hypothetical protein
VEQFDTILASHQQSISDKRIAAENLSA